MLAALGGLLLLYLVLPLAYLFFQVDWRELPAILGSPRAIRAVEVSFGTSAIAIAIMTLLGVPLSDIGSAYRLIRSEIIFLMKDRAGYVHYNTPDLFIKARRYVEIPIVQRRRKIGFSKWTLLMFVLFNFDIRKVSAIFIISIF